MPAAPNGRPDRKGPVPGGRLLVPPSWPRLRRVTAVLRSETVGGLLLFVGAIVAMIWVNSPWRDAYEAMTDAHLGPASLRLRLDVARWAADGLLAVFFFVVGLELKREFVLGELRAPRRALLPVVAAVGGMVVPAGVYLLVNSVSTAGVPRGWAVPTATDIAFAVAVLAIVSSHLPTALRSFLLTLAVVDDLLAVTVIAVFFTASFDLLALLASLVAVGLWAVLTHRGVTCSWLLAPLAVLAWGFMHASGVHATIAGVLLGFAVPARPGQGGSDEGLAERLERAWRPVSAGVAVPVFALMAAGVPLSGGGFGAALCDPVAIGVAAGLVVGKPVGVLGSTFLLARFTRAELDRGLSWWDVSGVALLAGVGFTVSLLIAELAFGEGSETDDHARLAILLGSLASALLAAGVLRVRDRAYRNIEESASLDRDDDGVPIIGG